MIKAATISECGNFRYTLTRVWDESQPWLGFIMLNPSTADADQDDPTIRKCIGFAKRAGFGGIVVTNLKAWRSTNPQNFAAFAAGPDNVAHIIAMVLGCDAVICAWGRNAPRKDADEMVAKLRKIGARPQALRLMPDGTPWHPLMLPYDLEWVDMP